MSSELFRKNPTTKCELCLQKLFLLRSQNDEKAVWSIWVTKCVLTGANFVFLSLCALSSPLAQKGLAPLL